LIPPGAKRSGREGASCGAP